MDDLKLKIKTIFIPYLIVSIATIVCYSLFRWGLDIKLGLIPLKEDVLNFWIPFIIPWIPILIWLRRRIRILKVRGKRDNGYFGYQFAMVGAIAIPLMISQNYIEKASYGLINIESAEDTKNYPREKYFALEDFNIEQNKCLSYGTARTAGRNNDDLDFYLYLSCPFNDSGVWYGVEYTRRISNRVSATTKDAEYRNFRHESITEFQSYYNFEGVVYFEKLGYSDQKDGHLAAIKSSPQNTIEKEQIILVPHKEQFSDRLGNTFRWIFGSFLIGSLILFGMIVIPKIDSYELNNFKKNKPLEDEDLQYILSFLNPRGEFGMTALLILVNFLVFIVMVFYGLNIISPTPQELLEIGGNRRTEVVNGEYWRLLSSVFIHGGFLHLFMNMFGLGLSGSLLEKTIGGSKLIGCFLICGILASISSIYWHESTVSVGASGAIFGLYGLILSFNVFRIYPEEMRSITWVFLALFAGLSLLFGFMGGIDNAAHIGGLGSGFMIGIILIFMSKNKLRGKSAKFNL